MITTPKTCCGLVDGLAFIRQVHWVSCSTTRLYLQGFSN